jgi:hypothetical protein
MLAVASPACETSESVDTKHDGSYEHSYVADNPSIAQADLERKFRNQATKLGYAAAPLYGNLGFEDEGKGLAAHLMSSKVMVVRLHVRETPRDAGLAFATQTHFDAARSLDRALGNPRWRSAKVDEAPDATHLEAVIEIAQPDRARVEAWATEQRLHRDGAHWLRKSAPTQTGVDVEILPDGTIDVSESRYGSATHCAEHPSRAQSNTSEDELLRTMMGEKR